jgi:dihydrofolate reductase
MKKVKLYIATSLDGYIARPDGSVDWLESLPNPNQLDYGYSQFLETIDTVVMGRKTYEEILGFGIPWPYGNCQTRVVTRNPGLEIRSENTGLLGSDLKTSLEELRQQPGKDIWIVGGGILISHLLSHDLIDEIILFMMPIVLGEGIPLFPKGTKEGMLKLEKVVTYETGVVELRYFRGAEV